MKKKKEFSTINTLSYLKNKPRVVVIILINVVKTINKTFKKTLEAHIFEKLIINIYCFKISKHIHKILKKRVCL